MDGIKVRSKVSSIFIIIWFALWANFLVRDLFIKEEIRDYMVLLERDTEGKRSYVYGDSLYELLRLAKDTLPEHGSMRFEGIGKESISYRRGLYYMYPAIERSDADYIIVFGPTGYKPDGYNRIAGLDNKRYILTRK